MDEIFEVLNLMDDGIDMNFVLNLAEEITIPLSNRPVIKHKVNKRPKFDYVEVVHTYSDESFTEHFRMSRIAVEELTGTIGHHLRLVSHQVPLDKKILFTLWMVGKQESFTSACDHFGIAKSTGHGIFVQIITALSEMSNSMIVWPDEERRLQSAEVFEERSCGIPGVVGVIDTSFVEIKQPVGNAVDYHIGNNHLAVVVQAVCDHNRKFIDVFAGMPGSMHEGIVFRNSPLYDRLTCIEKRLLPPDMHIIGNSTYPLLQSVLTPFQNNGHLHNDQVMYNVKLNSIRSTIEQSFVMLKEKFCRLKYLDMNDLDLLNNTIMACCFLHNFIINVDGVPDDGEMYQDDDGTEVIDKAIILPHELNQSKRGGEKRNYIVTLVA